MKYAIEVSETGSINKASENLFIAQPNLSRAIKELESDLGVTLFERTRKGMTLTAEGRDFVGQAKHILEEIRSVENMYKEKNNCKRRLSVCSCSSAYITSAFIKTADSMFDSQYELSFHETDSESVVKSVCSGESRIGIVRITDDNKNFHELLSEDKGISSEIICEGELYMLVNIDNETSDNDLSDFTEICSIHSIDKCRKHIYAEGIEKQAELVSAIKNSFMFCMDSEYDYLEKYGLKKAEYPETKKYFEDILIYRKECKLTETELRFINELRFFGKKEKL